MMVPPGHASLPKGSGTAPEVAVRTVLIVDDQTAFADLLEVALSGQPDLRSVGVAYDVPSALAAVAREHPDIVLMDVRLGPDGPDGVEAAAEILARHPETHVVLLTGDADATLVSRAASAGVCSLQSKNGSLPSLLRALRSVRRGALAVDPAFLTIALDEIPAGRSPGVPALSPRERDVLAMLKLGLDARAIASHLGISVNTSRGYIKTLLRKLDAHSQLEAVAIAQQYGL